MLTWHQQTVYLSQVEQSAASRPISEAHELYCAQCRAQCNLGANRRPAATEEANIQQPSELSTLAANLSATLVGSAMVERNQLEKLEKLRCACRLHLAGPRGLAKAEARASAQLGVRNRSSTVRRTQAWAQAQARAQTLPR